MLPDRSDRAMLAEVPQSGLVRQLDVIEAKMLARESERAIR